MMPEVSFYILTSTSELSRYQYVCKLVEKIYRSGSQVLIITDSNALSRRLDDLLWTFRPGSFIPHQHCSGPVFDSDTPVLITEKPSPVSNIVNFLNLSETIPDDLAGVERVLEVLYDDATNKQAGRQKYRNYQQLGCKLTTFNVSAN